MDLEKLKKVTLISFIVTVLSFILMLITRYKFPSIWFVARAIIFISGIVYLVAITSCTIVAKKNKVKLTGWLGALQGITVCIVIVGIIGMISMIQMDNKQEEHYKQGEQELKNDGYTTSANQYLQNENNENFINTATNGTITTNNAKSESKVLDVIDIENQEFKINGMELIEAIEKAYKKQLDSSIFDYKLMEDSNGIKAYSISYNAFSIRSNIYGKYSDNFVSFPAIVIGINNKTGNTVFIAVGDPYKGDEHFDDYYLLGNLSHLKEGLNSLGYTELWQTMITIIDANDKDYYNNGLNGVYYNYILGQTVPYANAGVYYLRFTAMDNNLKQSYLDNSNADNINLSDTANNNDTETIVSNANEKITQKTTDNSIDKQDSAKKTSSKKETKFIGYAIGYELEGYTRDLEDMGFKYTIKKVQDLNHYDNSVVKIEPNYKEVVVGSTIELTVTDNTYDMNVLVDTSYLMGLAGVKRNSDSNDNIQLTLIINGNIVFDGETKICSILSASSLGKITGKRTDNYIIEATVNGTKISKDINYFIRCNPEVQQIEIYAGGDIGAG